MDRIGLKGLILGIMGGLAFVLVLHAETTYLFPLPNSKPEGFYLLSILMGGAVGWSCGQFRSRACPKCGTEMGTPHFPSGEASGPILYECPKCRTFIAYEDVVAAEETDWSA